LAAFFSVEGDSGGVAPTGEAAAWSPWSIECEEIELSKRSLESDSSLFCSMTFN